MVRSIALSFGMVFVCCFLVFLQGFFNGFWWLGEVLPAVVLGTGFSDFFWLMFYTFDLSKKSCFMNYVLIFARFLEQSKDWKWLEGKKE